MTTLFKLKTGGEYLAGPWQNDLRMIKERLIEAQNGKIEPFQIHLGLNKKDGQCYTIEVSEYRWDLFLALIFIFHYKVPPYHRQNRRLQPRGVHELSKAELAVLVEAIDEDSTPPYFYLSPWFDAVLAEYPEAWVYVNSLEMQDIEAEWSLFESARTN